MSEEDLRLADLSLVPDILKILECDFHSILARSFLELYTSRQAKDGYNLNVILLTPGGKVTKYGTFVFYVADHNLGIFYTLNPDFFAIGSLIAKSKDIPWQRAPGWSMNYEIFQPTLDNIYFKKNLIRSVPDFVGSCYSIDIDEAKKITYMCPPEVYLAPVKKEHSEFINSHWPFKTEHSAKTIKFIIGVNGGIGLYLKESNELIAWCLIWLHKGPGQIFVTDEHRGKGYGNLVAKALTKFLADKGIQPILNIHKENTISQKLFGKIGYQPIFGVRRSSAGPQI